jgi:hypothetical protein
MTETFSGIGTFSGQSLSGQFQKQPFLVGVTKINWWQL